MSVKVKFKVGIKKNINTIFNVENKEPIKTIFRINAGTAAFSSLLGNPYDNTALAAALDLKADKTAVAEQIETVTDLINSTSTTLDNKIDTVQSDLSGDISTLSETVAANFNTLLGNIQNEATTRAENDTLLQGDINTLQTNLTSEISERTAADNTLQGNIATLNETVSNNYSDLNGKITLINGEISNLSDTVGDNYTALSGQISDLSGTVESYNTSTNGRIDTLSQTVSTNDTAINNKVDGINTTLTNSINSLSDTVTDNYNALDARITTNASNIATNAGNITTINSKIPNQASSSNQLADKDFVNSSIATNTANFIGTFNSVAELEAYSGTLTNNDYAFVVTTGTTGNTLYDRYKYNVDTQEWMFEYELNNSSFTAQQWASINSGIDSNGVAQITLNQSAIGTINTTLATFGNIVTHNVSEFATAAQGTKADTALQPNDNISDLYNDVGYTTNEGTVTSVNNVTPDADGNVTLIIPDPTNMVTTNTAQNISGRKTFIGEKAIYFKQSAATDKLGFTLYSPSDAELAALEWRPNTISGNALLALNCPQAGTNYVGFRYWSNINIVAPRPTTNGTYFIPVNVTDGTNTVTANNNGILNISTLLPDVSNFVTNTSLATTLEDYALSADIPTKTSDLTNDSNFATVSQIPTNNNQLTNGAGYITNSALNGYATQTWVQNQNYLTSSALADYVTNSTLTATLADYALLSDIPTVPTTDQTYSSTSTNPQSGTAVAEAIASVTTPIATSSTVGTIKPDNTTTKVDANGTLSAISRNVGEIVQSTLPLTDAGLHLLDGTRLSGDGIYKEFVDYIAELYADNPNANCFCTETEWQNSVTTYGSCGKFVYNSTNNTVRLPKVSDILQGTTDLSALGDLIEAGLPNITGSFGYNVLSDGSIGPTNTSAIYATGEYSTGGGGNTFRGRGLGFDASRSSSIYGNSSTVQPQTIKTLLYIVIATSSKTDVQVDIDEIATDLNGKVDTDLSNVSNTAGFRKLVELYNNGTSFYKIYKEYNPQDGSYVGKWCEQGGQISYSSPTWYSVAFLKPFVDTNYLVYGTYITPADMINNASLAIEKSSPSSCSITVYGIGFTAVWYACGYIS